MGGDGLAFPAGTWSLMNPDTFFIGRVPYFLGFPTDGLRLFDLREVQLDRRGAAKDGDVDAELLFLGLHLDDRTREVGERAVDDPHRLVDLEGDAGLGAGGPLGHGDVDVLDLRLFDRLR